MTLKIYFLRHGQTALSKDNLFCGSGSNPGLTEEGKEMARQFGETYKTLEWKAIYTSPLIRTHETAEPLRAALNTQLVIREGLKEIDYGAWEGKSVEQVESEFHDDHLRWKSDPAWNAPTKGEQAIKISQRATAVVEEIVNKYSSGNVLVVSHKATIRIIICSLLGIDVGRFRERIGCPVASLSMVEFAQRGPLVHTIADRSHLSGKLRNLEGT
ncbi:MAG: histidine phosphatase family protein [Proteobacteria bacterium]|nr:histidine phosphatase family protein [Pseudomonadota bacterium]